MSTKLKTCCGCMPLRNGVNSIGFYDVINFLLDLIWLIIALAGGEVFIISQKAQLWLLIVRMAGIGALRSLSFLLLWKFNYRPIFRLIMFIVRIITIVLQIFIMIYSYSAFYNTNSGIFIYDSIFIVIDIYFALVILSFYLTSDQEERVINDRIVRQRLEQQRQEQQYYGQQNYLTERRSVMMFIVDNQQNQPPNMNQQQYQEQQQKINISSQQNIPIGQPVPQPGSYSQPVQIASTCQRPLDQDIMRSFDEKDLSIINEYDQKKQQDFEFRLDVINNPESSIPGLSNQDSSIIINIDEPEVFPPENDPQQHIQPTEFYQSEGTEIFPKDRNQPTQVYVTNYQVKEENNQVQNKEKQDQ